MGEWSFILAWLRVEAPEGGQLRSLVLGWFSNQAVLGGGSLPEHMQVKKKKECEKVVLVGSKAFEPPLCLWQRSGQPLSGPGHLGRTRQRHEALVIFLMNVADPFVQLEAHKLTFFFNAFGFYQLCLLWVLGICPFTVWIK